MRDEYNKLRQQATRDLRREWMYSIVSLIAVIAVLLVMLFMSSAYGIVIDPSGKTAVTVICPREQNDCTVFDTTVYHVMYGEKCIDGSYRVRYYDGDRLMTTWINKNCRVIEPEFIKEDLNGFKTR